MVYWVSVDIAAVEKSDMCNESSKSDLIALTSSK